MTIAAQSAAITGQSFREERNTICNFVIGGMTAAGGMSYLAGRLTGNSLAKAMEVINPTSSPTALKTIDEFSSLAIAGCLFLGYFRKEITNQVQKFDEYRRQNKH